MEWLMGKARGVGKGFINSTNSISQGTVSENGAQGNLPSPGVICPPHGPIVVDIDPKISTRDMLLQNGSRSVSPVNFISPSLQTSAVVTSAYALKNVPSKTTHSPTLTNQAGNDTACGVQIPSFMQEKYLFQQLPISSQSKYVDFLNLVEPFPSMDQNEWLAAHTIALFDNMSTIFDAIHELCTCPQLLPPQTTSVNSHPISVNHVDMHSGNISDDDKSKKNKNSTVGTNVPSGLACQEIDTALSSCHDLIQSSRIFPVRQGDPFPPDLPAYVTLVCKNLLLCIIHIYLAHFHHLEQLELVAHMNTLTKHFFAFTNRFSLVEEKHFDPLLGFHRLLLEVNPSKNRLSSGS
ncbi:MOB kinase activator 2 [Paragonimus heterotremus]|uniref:MOB kinase activator 2 n=1 Tax=Paragonimus heterotremus TaxID=100268 RepID=A0A8J4WU09_9TREM|nr:MOB kinase activator 2 [Paragonimus heterotremus]